MVYTIDMDISQIPMSSEAKAIMSENMKDKKTLELGNNNFTEINGGRVLKKPNPNGVGFMEHSYDKQVTQWNKYYKDTIYATACITSDGKLSTPYIEGSYPTDVQRLAICEDMINKNFIMVDCRDKRNFIVHPDGQVFPIDFGQMYSKDDRYYNTHLQVINKQLNTLKSNIQHPRSQHTLFEKPQKSDFEDVKVYIAELDKYKKSLETIHNDPLAKEKVNSINSFIEDTTTRIAKYKNGNMDAFKGYIETNQTHLNNLTKNRTTRPLVYSMLLSLMVIPAIYGVIQLALTRGNTYLFHSTVKQSEQRALHVQNKLISDTENLASRQNVHSNSSKK